MLDDVCLALAQIVLKNSIQPPALASSSGGSYSSSNMGECLRPALLPPPSSLCCNYGGKLNYRMQSDLPLCAVYAFAIASCELGKHAWLGVRSG